MQIRTLTIVPGEGNDPIEPEEGDWPGLQAQGLEEQVIDLSVDEEARSDYRQGSEQVEGGQGDI